MATKTIPKSSDRQTLEKHLQEKLKRIIELGDEDAIKVRTMVLDAMNFHVEKEGAI